MAAGTTPTLTARDSSQIFSVGKVWRSLLKHSSIIEFGPVFSWTALKLHKDLFTSWLVFICIHHVLSTRRPLGEKWQRRHFTGYVLLVPAASRPDTVRACVPHPCYVVRVWRFIFSGGTTTCAAGSCTNPTSHPNAGDWSKEVTETRAGQTPHTHSAITGGLVSPGFSLGSATHHSSCQVTASSGKDDENSSTSEPCAASPVLTSCSEPAQPLLWIGILQGVVCQTHSSPRKDVVVRG